jgi:hypothetical protein
MLFFFLFYVFFSSTKFENNTFCPEVGEGEEEWGGGPNNVYTCK